MLIHPSGALRQKKVYGTQKAAGEGRARPWLLFAQGWVSPLAAFAHPQGVERLLFNPERVAAQSPALLERAALPPQRIGRDRPPTNDSQGSPPGLPSRADSKWPWWGQDLLGSVGASLVPNSGICPPLPKRRQVVSGLDPLFRVEEGTETGSSALCT